MSNPPISHDLLEKIRLNVRVEQLQVRDILVGARVKFRAWMLNGAQRTGKITEALVDHNGHIVLGVAVDRADGRPGVLVDTWYGRLDSVEVENAL